MNMAKQKQPTKAVKPTKPTAQKFSIEKLRQNCTQLFNVSGSTFAGVTYGLEGSYSVEEMKQIIEEWRKEGVN